MKTQNQFIMSDVFHEPVYVAKGNNHTFPIVKIKNGLYRYYSPYKTLHMSKDTSNLLANWI